MILRPVTALLMAVALLSCGKAPSSPSASTPSKAATVISEDAESLEHETAPGQSQDADSAPKAMDAVGVRLTPTTQIFVEGVTYVGEPLPVLALVQSDNPDICRHLQEGTMPRDSAMFAAVVLQWGQGPYRVGASYPGQAHMGREQAPYCQGFFRALDHQCTISPEGETGVGLEFNYGALVLREYTPRQRAVADFKFRLEADGELLDGHIDATFCDAPAFFENPEVFLLPVDEAACKP